MNIIQKTSPNYEHGRRGNSPHFIVIHIAEGNESQVYQTFADNSSSNANPVSAHYLVCVNGNVDQFVLETDTAWHAGNVVNPTAQILRQYPFLNPNLISVGIEHEGFTDINEFQYQTSAQLIEGVSSRWGIPLDAEHIIPHRSIRATKTCPNNIDVNRLIQTANNIRNGVSNPVPESKVQLQLSLTQKLLELYRRVLALIRNR